MTLLIIYFCNNYLILLSDPTIKATVRKHLLSISGRGEGDKIKITGVHTSNIPRPEPAVHKSYHAPHRYGGTTNGSCAPEQEPLLGKENQVSSITISSNQQFI